MPITQCQLQNNMLFFLFLTSHQFYSFHIHQPLQSLPLVQMYTQFPNPSSQNYPLSRNPKKFPQNNIHFHSWLIRLPLILKFRNSLVKVMLFSLYLLQSQSVYFFKKYIYVGLSALHSIAKVQCLINLFNFTLV